jgi:radical SAM protein with 4Fe4S-binding SPASM domain
VDRYPIPHPAVLKEIIRQETPLAPLTAMIHISEHCNVRCEFCWHHSFLKKDKPRAQHMETAEVLAMIKELAAMGTQDITLSANGEPTSHPGFPAIVAAVKDHGMRIKVVTNLTFFSAEVAAALAKTDHLIVNLAAADQASYQAVYAPRGQVSFDGIVRNIRSLTAIKGGPQIKIGYVLTKNTFRHIAQTIDLAAQCGIDSIRFKFMDPLSFTESLILDGDDRQWLADEIVRLLKNPDPVPHNLGDILDEISPSKKTEQNEHGRCFIGWIVVNINENGSVTLCCQNDHLIIGNWKEQPLKDIWEGQTAQEFRHTAKKKIDFENPLWHACKTCHYSNPKHYARRINHEFAPSLKT